MKPSIQENLELHFGQIDFPKCKCGCGLNVARAKNQFITGHNRRGLVTPEKTRLLLHLANKGKVPPPHVIKASETWRNHLRKHGHSLATRLKMSKTRKGVPHNPVWNEKVRLANIGKKMSESSKEKCRAATKRRPLSSFVRGERHPAWKGGVTPINKKLRLTREMIQWRSDVFSRDNWTCQLCFVRGGDLRAHHIKPFAAFPELRADVSNGITFHDYCHRLVHKNDGMSLPEIRAKHFPTAYETHTQTH